MRKLLAFGVVLFASLFTSAKTLDAAWSHCSPVTGSSVSYSFLSGTGWHRAVGIYRSGEPEYGPWTTARVARVYPDPGRSFTGSTCRTL